MMKILISILCVFMVAACGSPRVVQGESEDPSAVSFQLTESYESKAPECIGVLPIEDDRIEDKYLNILRRAVVAQLAPKGYRQIAISQIDKALGKNNQIVDLAKALHCDAFIEVAINDFGKSFVGIYSEWYAHATLKLVRANDHALLWQGSHKAKISGGAFPMSPLSIASGLFMATNNLVEEQGERVANDLARRLLATLPEREHPLEKIQEPAEILAATEPDVDDFSLKIKETIKQKNFQQALKHTQEAIKAEPKNVSFRLEHTRALTLTGQWEKAVKSAEQGISLHPNDASWYDMKAYSLTQLALTDQAQLAYVEAIKINPKDAFAHFNLGQLKWQINQADQALNYLTQAGQLYMENGDKDRASMVLEVLSQLRQQSAG